MKNVTEVKTGGLVLDIEGGVVRKDMKGGFIKDPEVYASVVDNMIIVCTDVVFIDRKNKLFYLAKRCIKPMEGIWVIGGKRNKGETPVEGMMRNLNRETGLAIDDKRLEFITVTEYVWQDREQQPQGKGSQNLCHQFSLELTEEELKFAAEHLSPKEYDVAFGLQPYDFKRMIKEEIHPVLPRVYDIVFPKVA